jgi:hypothetical protein
MPPVETTIQAEPTLKPGADAPVAAPAQKFARETHTVTHATATTKDAAQLIPGNQQRQMAVVVGLYAILVSGALWASLNLLRWFWHQLL